jgi:Ni/Fe-hydrogenase subunit HybB-like protein
MDRVRRLKLALWTIAGLAAAVAISRFLYGLGETTNLSDATPWGLWIGFDVMSGVALAAGGFVLTATVYIFKLEKFHAIVRPAVLTAFLGYAAVVAGLLFDLGLPWNIWHMVVFWNPRSPLFEVGWCVMLYLAVLALEFFPVPAEEFRSLARPRRMLLKLRLPLVITGIALSTLHQSSLGSLFLIMPYHLHPLWYSPLLPVNFFVSAVALGLLMVLFENHVTAYLYRRKAETSLLSGLAGTARWVLVAYLALRIGDLAARGQLGWLRAGGWRTGMFWLELTMVGAAPALLFSVPRLRRSRAGQWGVSAIGILGVVLNRVNVGGVIHLGRGDSLYLPAWTELVISAGVVAGAALAFLFFIERFRVWEQRPADPEADPVRLPELDRIDATWLGAPGVAARTVYSLAFILAAAIGFAILSPETAAASRGVRPAPARHARGGEVLWIDGNLDGYGVSFRHEEHQKRTGGKSACARCHHMNLPRDRDTGCHECHSDMYLPADAFRHDWHASLAGAGLACYECHRKGEVRSAATAKGCGDCHKDLVPAAAVISVKQYQAVGYAHAMHRLCVGCHAAAAREKQKPELARCAWCHKETREPVDAGRLSSARRQLMGKRVVLPPY